MTTVAARGSGTPTTTGTTWATVTNAVDGAAGTNPATYTTYTNATASAVATMEITGYGFSTSIAASDTLNSVTVSLRHFENNTGRFASVRFQAFDGATAIGTATTCTLATGARNDTATPAVTLAQLRSATFKIVVTITGAASTQSRVESIDYCDVTADYTIVPPSITQAAYRFYADGTETGATVLAAQDTGYTVDTSGGDVNLQVRARLQSTTAVAVPAADDWQLQWEKNTSGSWIDAGKGLVGLDGSQEASTFSRFFSAGDAQNAIGQSFVATTSGKLTRADFQLFKTGAPPGTVKASLYAHTGSFGTTSGIATGSPLAESTPRTATTLQTTYQWESFTFDGTYSLVSGTPYVIVAEYITGDSSNYLNSRFQNTEVHAGTNVMRLTAGGTWTASSAGTDTAFRVYTTGAASTVAPYASANLTDGAVTTNRLGAGTGSFVAGKISEDGLVDDLGWSANNHTEVLYSVTLKQADLAPTDTLRFRVLRNAATTGMTYTQVPSITIGAGAPTDRTGVATGSLTLSGTATGSKEVTATATGTVTLTGTASGSAAAAPVLATATGTLTVAGVAAGVHGVAGTATGTLTVTGAAAGSKTVTATGTGQLTVAGTASGVRGRPGVATGAVTLEGVAAGTRGATGTATGALTVAGAAAGAVSGAVTGQATATLTLAGTAAGVKTVGATATGALTVAGVASGQKTVRATATGSLTVAGTSSGTKTVTATAAGQLTLAGTASGARTVTATATGQIVFASVALGLVEGNAVGRAAGAITVAGTSSGVRGRPGQATGTITVVGLAVGRRATTATATGIITVAGHAIAVRANIGTATGAITITGTALGRIPVAFDISGQWNGQPVDALQWGEATVVDWYMVPT